MWHWCLKELMVGCGVALVVCGGIWQDRREAVPAAAPLDLMSIPSQLEDWESTDFQLKERDLKAAGIDRYLARDYVQAETGNTFKVLIVSGPGGPISVHPPEVCFAGQGYLAESVISSVKLPAAASDREHQFSTAIFRGPESSGGLRVQLFWSWSDTGIWSTPSNPRLVFARLPRLYKIYVSRALTPQQGRDDVQDGLDFMKLLLPEFERLLPAAQSPSTPAVPQPADPATETAGAGSLLPEFDQCRMVRRNVRQFARPRFAQFPDNDGDFRL